MNEPPRKHSGNDIADKDLNALLQGGRQRPWWQRAGAWITLVLIGAGVYVAAQWLSGGRDAVTYRTVEAGRGDITVLVTATGTLQPVNQVEVGSELSGTIQRVHVDYNDRITRGQLIAELDTVRLEAQVFQARASLASTEARIEEALATVIETEARFRRCEQLAARQLCSQEELDTLRAAQVRAKAGERSAAAEVAVARATLEAIETDLAKAKIRSPIDGVVLKRQIEPGQTVAASLQTPVLFVLAEDLRRMRLHVFVDEADIGQVREGQAATFTVDAWPNRTFPAEITQVRFAPQEVEGTSVVSYEAILAVDNAELLLLPGMTATADIVVQHISDAILVPNAALRFRPPPAEPQQAASGGNVLTSLFIRPPRQRPMIRTVRDMPGDERELWVLEQDTPVQYPVRIGVTDGRVTEIVDGEITAGMTLITGIVAAQ
jgi:HlyD family secretion protein